jgi:hypothetical protein
MMAVAVIWIILASSFGASSFGPIAGLASSVTTAIEVGAAGNKESILTSSTNGKSQSPMPAEEVARNFYRWYLNALYRAPNGDPFIGYKAVVEQYITARLLQKLANSRRAGKGLKGADVDTEYFFGTLDLSSEWEKNITVASPATVGAAEVVHISFSGTAENRGRLGVEEERKVVLKQEGGLWKVDEVGVWSR